MSSKQSVAERARHLSIFESYLKNKDHLANEKNKNNQMQRQLSVAHFDTCTVIWLTGLQNSAVEQCIIQISCVENFKQVSHQHCNMGSLAEYCRAVNVSVEIQHETKKNLISTSTFSPTTYILHLKHRIYQGYFTKSGSV